MKRFAASLVIFSLAACRTAGPAPTQPAAPLAEPAAIDEAALDRSVEPCTDFYQFACGGWLKTVEIPADRPIWSRGIMELRERNLLLLRQILEADAAGRGDPSDPYAKKVGDFYAACMDEAGTEARGLQDLQAEWARIDQISDRAAVADELAYLHGRGLFPLFAFGSDQDARDATQVIAVVVQGGLSLPDRDYYLSQDAKMVEIRGLFDAHVVKMLELAGVAHVAAAQGARDLFQLERAIAESHWSVVEMRNPERTYNRVELAGLEKLAPHLAWKRYLAGLGHPEITTISVTTPKELQEVDRLLETAPLATWRLYFKWQLLSEMARERALPQRFVDENFAFVSQAFTGSKALEARWKRCVSLMDDDLGEAVGRTYVQRYFGADGKARTDAMVAEIEGAMRRDLEAVLWMDAGTREKALAKLAKVENKIGYPERWRSYDALSVDRGSFFKSLLSASAFEVQRDLRKIGRPLDRSEWLTSPATVNAFYNPSMNEITFPAGILQPPIFNRAAPPAVNFGSVGMIVGHELTHGFDDTGRQYDGQGNLRDWWTDAAAKEFERRAECVAKQYDGYVAVGDVHLNGHLTLGENLADLGGTKLAYAGFQAARAGKSPPPTVAGFSADQQFFLGLAQGWCTQMREPFARMLAATDPHSPAQYRVNGPLSNLPEFAAAFQCSAGRPMVRPPEQRCVVW
jgi:endothelin-converting enzyme/putative endopeptidase